MGLISIHQQNPDALIGYRVEQIVALSGDGRLRDGSECSTELRAYLQKLDINRINTYIHETLTEKFSDSGFILQDLVNELGRRLNFKVENGRYHGVTNKPGHDGYWESAEARFVVEVKTTDAYRINLSTIASYAMKLKLKEPVDNPKPLGLLIVVGRQDTGDLEAQIRGSKYAWDVRVISAESLIELTRLHGIAVDSETEKALRHSLMPVEYTRVDHLVDLLSRVAFDIERSSQVFETVNEVFIDSKNYKNSDDKNSFEIKPVEVIRNDLIEAINKEYKEKFDRSSRSLLVSNSGKKIILSISKRYQRIDQQYWYALHARWITVFNEDNSFLCLGMSDKKYYLMIPGLIVRGFLDMLTRTEKSNTIYWHLGLTENKENITLHLTKPGKLLDLTQFKV